MTANATDVLAALEEYDGNYQAAADSLGLKYSTFQGRVYSSRKKALAGEVAGPPIPQNARPPVGFIVAKNSATFDGAGKLRSQSIQHKRDAGDVFGIPDGHVVKGESALVDADGRVVQRWIKTAVGGSGGLVDGLRAAFAEYDGVAPVIKEPAASDDDLLTEYPVPDLHLGALAWGRETGENYDVKIAVDTAMQSVQALVDRSHPSKEAVLLFLGDFTHANDQKAATPGSGHRLDVAGRWQKVYAAAAKLAVDMINVVARKHPVVRVKFLPGNHDTDAAPTITVALSLFFSNNPRIIIDDSPAIAWFHRHGKCLLGGTHGHTMKPDAMAMVMAVDCAQDWGQTTFRHIAYGHIHHETMKEVMGVRVESFQALAARDAYNAEHGYRSGRSLSALTWHKELGEIGRHRVNISGPAGKKAA